MIAGLRFVLAELVGLFVDDALFAGAIALWLLLVGALAYAHAGSPQADAFVLWTGLLAIIVTSVARGATLK